MNWAWIGTTPAGFARNFYSYCVDVQHNLTDPETVVARSSTGFTNGVVGGGEKAAWLFDNYAGAIRSAIGMTAAQANTNAAALQVAIWEAMYDTSNSLTGGSFRLAGASLGSAVQTQANAYLRALYSGAGGAYQTSVATILDVVSPNSGQDQIVSRVAEPSTLMMMGVALLVFVRRARRTNSESARA